MSMELDEDAPAWNKFLKKVDVIKFSIKGTELPMFKRLEKSAKKGETTELTKSFSKKYAELMNIVKQNQSELETYKKILETFQESMKAKDTEIFNLKSQVIEEDKMSEEIEHSRKQTEHLKAQISILGKENILEDLDKSNSNHSNQVRESNQEEIEEYQNKISELEEKIKNMEIFNKKMEEENKRLEQQNLKRDKEFNDLKELINEHSKVNHIYKEDIWKKEYEIIELKKSNKLLKDELEEKNKEIEDFYNQ